MPGIIDNAVKQAPQRGGVKRATSPDSERVVIAAKKIMAQPQVAQHLVQIMQSESDPATGIAQATIFIMKQLYEKSGGTMPPKAIIPAAQEILVDVMRLGQSAGLFKITPELTKQAVQRAIQMFTESVKAQEQPAQEQPAMQPEQSAMQPGGQQAMMQQPMMGG